MPTKDRLQSAVSAGIITADQADRLGDFFNKSGSPDKGCEDASDSTSEPHEALAADSSKTAADLVEDNEAPRFLRGFHDVLITIGVAVGLGGVSMLASTPWLLLMIWLFAEYFIRVQRLALPAVFLSVVWSLTAIWAVIDLLPWMGELDGIAVGDGALRLLVWSAITAGCTGLFFLRFRTPVALAGFWVAVGVVPFAAISYAYLMATGFSQEEAGFWVVDSLLPFAGAIGVFGIACWFDFSDPKRLTRRSDTAFWLHMVAAPALLFTTLNLLHSPGIGFFERFQGASPSLVLPVLVCFVIIGVLLDRRAFVTSGMLSLGTAIAFLIERLDLRFLEMTATSAIAVSFIVLSVAVGWTPMRRNLLPLLPQALSRRLPPVTRPR